MLSLNITSDTSQTVILLIKIMSNSGQRYKNETRVAVVCARLKRNQQQVLRPEQQKTFSGKSGQQKTSSQKKKKKPTMNVNSLYTK